MLQLQNECFQCINSDLEDTEIKTSQSLALSSSFIFYIFFNKYFTAFPQNKKSLIYKFKETKERKQIVI